MVSQIKVKPLVLISNMFTIIGVLIAIFIFIRYLGAENYLFVIGAFGLLAVSYVWTLAVNLLWHKIIIDEEGFQFIRLRQHTDIKWQDVKFAQVVGESNKKVLTLGTDHWAWNLELSDFNPDEVWNEVQKHLGHDKLDRDAYKETLGYKDWQIQKEELTSGEAVSIHDSYFIQGLGWICTLFFLGCAVFALRESWVFVLFFTPFILLGLLIIGFSGTTTISPQEIRRKDKLGVYQILWSEVKFIGLAPKGDGMVFEGTEKRVAAAGPAQWEKKNRELFKNTLSAIIEKYNIEVREDKMAALKMNKNSKI